MIFGGDRGGRSGNKSKRLRDQFSVARFFGSSDRGEILLMIFWG
jgi:hypothetical protein